MKKAVAVFLLVLFSFLARGQQEANIWYFGRKAGLDFSSGAPVSLEDSQMETREGCISVADQNGNLLFYSNGETIWNKNHQPMPNGENLAGHSSATQGCVAVLVPGSSSLYYLFTVDAIENSFRHGLRYSVIDMNLQGGLGDLTEKNVLMEPDVTERITVARHANGRDFWVIVHKWNSDAFVAFWVKPKSVMDRVVSTIGVKLELPVSNAAGYLKASPRGNKLAMVVQGKQSYYLYDFNQADGTVSNEVSSLPNFLGIYGLAFSPDGTKLYGGNRLKLYQFDLSASSSMLNAQEVATGKGAIYGMQLGPDGKIYVAQSGYNFLGVIQNPNAAGIACNYAAEGPYLGSNTGVIGLPNHAPFNFFKPAIKSFRAAEACFGEKTNFSLPLDLPGFKYSWDFGDPASGPANHATGKDPSHTFSAPGTYTVTLTVNDNGLNNLVKQPVEIKPLPSVHLGKDTVLCAGTTLTLQAGNPGATFQWQDGSTASAFVVSQPGRYTVAVKDAAGCVAQSSINVQYLTPPVVSLGQDTTLCQGQTLKLAFNLPGVQYLWQDGSTGNNFTITGPGRYWLRVTSGHCSESDTLLVRYRSNPPVAFKGDTVLCKGNTLLLSAQVPGGHYLWQDNSTGPTFLVREPGTYRVNVTQDYCQTASTIRIAYQDCTPFIPNIFTPNGDRLNETFLIRNIEVARWQLQIYNRLGRLIYQSDSYQNDWDGQGAAAGIYFYKLVNQELKQLYKGYFEIIR